MRRTSLFDTINPFRPVERVSAHCDLMCGVYYPEQARIEAESVMNSAVKYHDSDDEVFRARAIQIKEERADLVKHHLSVLWTDYFKPEHVEEYPELHELVWKTIKQAGDAKKSVDPDDGQKLIDMIDEIAVIFWKTKGGKPDWMTTDPAA